MDRSLGKWKLPQPTDIKEENEWLPVPRIARTVPFGYEVDPEDEDLLLPIPKELDHLEKAKAYVRQYSLRQVLVQVRVLQSKPYFIILLIILLLQFMLTVLSKYMVQVVTLLQPQEHQLTSLIT